MDSDTETAPESVPEKTRHLQTDSGSSNNPDHALSQKTRWAYTSRVQDMHNRDKASGLPEHKLGITWNNLTVEAVSAGAALHENVVSQFNIPKLISESRHKAPLRTILSKSHGCVKPGEMLLVLGRPGSGCTTLLNLLANKRKGYANISGDVHYGSMSANEAKRYRGQIVMNSEEEIFFPSLTVGQTIDFATRLKIPHTLPNGVSSAEDLRLDTKEFLLKSMNIEHTNDTKVGNEYVRGVSGGERKRVSILETMATRGSVFCWDNSTRGLDANTALEYTKCIRAMTDILGLSSIVTLYQAGNGIYDLFDKVLVLDEGKEVFYGPREQARPFMESLGFVCSDGANVGDYLTGVTVPTERKIMPGFEGRFPRTADALLAEYERTPIRQQMATEYDYYNSQEAKDNTAEFQSSVIAERHPRLPQSSPYTTSFFAQILAVVVRQYQIIWGDKVSFFIKQILTIVQALIAGSLFYNAPDNSGGLFLKGGACFFTLLYPLMVAQSETTDSFTGRPVLLKHKGFAYFHPATFVLAQIASDIPVVLFQTISLTVIVYWMVGLTASAGAFFTYFVVTLATTLCVVALFRAIGAGFKTFDGASKASGFLIAAIVLYGGYTISKPKMHPWFVWIFWINPMSYAFDALLSNELHGKVIPCVGTNLIPFGPGYSDGSPQACSGIGGAVPGQDFIAGDDYLSSLSYSHSHIWRNFGVVLAFWVLFVALTAFFVTNWKSVSEDGPTLVIPRENSKLVAVSAGRRDEESQAGEKVVQSPASSGEVTEVDEPKDLVRNTSVFTWKNLSYTVKTPSGDRVLLDNVQGWVKPGMLGALMGSSGAGKTTLLDVLAQRKTDGTVRGSILVDGRELPVSFQRSIGYCEQLDIFEPLATVREALEFSALLRQSRDTPREEKLKYVNTIIDLLELHDLADTLIGRPGAGLTVEQRKRVTISVELVSKPSILIFLDEPTSGLDGQSAFNTVRFLKKLAAVGQAVLVTIHQPSAQLFYQFDSLLLLAKGGKTVYFGDIGEQAATVKEYFAKNGAPCPDETNPAEHMIDVVSGSLSQDRDWSQVWLQAPEYTAMTKELDRIIDDAASKPPGSEDDHNEFAMSLWYQTKMVTHRMNVSLFRNTDYVNNKVILHIFSALFNGFTFWMIGDSVSDLQLCLFTIFSFIFVAPGTIAQLQPLFIQRRDIFEAREKKSKTYSWVAFVTGLIVSEVPYLIICAVFYFVCWYYTVGFPNMASRAGSTFFVMFLYEFLYTGMGQFVAAYAPNEVAAALVNPIIIGVLVSFCGVLIPYAQIQAFWRYWIYYLDPFNYVMGSMLVFGIWGREIKCSGDEFAVFNPPGNSTCQAYLSDYLNGDGPGRFANLINPDATEGCRVCSYSRGEDYLSTLNLGKYMYGWRDAGIVAIFVFSSYALVYALMKLRTKTTKKAE